MRSWRRAAGTRRTGSLLRRLSGAGGCRFALSCSSRLGRAMRSRRTTVATPGLLRLLATPGLRRTLRARLEHRQGNATTLLVDFDHPHADDIADRHDFVRIADELVGQAADVHQPAVFQSDVDEGPKVDHVEHAAGELHAGVEVLQL